MGVDEHKRASPTTVRCGVLTVSDSREARTDLSGAEIRRLLTNAGHSVLRTDIVPDEPDRIADVVKSWAGSGEIQVILVNGGTGLAPRDRTYEALEPLLDRRIDGFGELFRFLSFGEIGPAAMLSRAVAGVVGATVLFALPGSTAGCRLALERLILPELGHIVHLIRAPHARVS
jgi:molybdenum cofactor biosynthesis protein B